MALLCMLELYFNGRNIWFPLLLCNLPYYDLVHFLIVKPMLCLGFIMVWRIYWCCASAKCFSLTPHGPERESSLVIFARLFWILVIFRTSPKLVAPFERRTERLLNYCFTRVFRLDQEIFRCLRIQPFWSWITRESPSDWDKATIVNTWFPAPHIWH